MIVLKRNVDVISARSFAWNLRDVDETLSRSSKHFNRFFVIFLLDVQLVAFCDETDGSFKDPRYILRS